MQIKFNRLTDVKEVTKYNTGVKPRYGKKGSTSRGSAWCSCGQCVGSLLLFLNGTVKGWFETECGCGNRIDWSEVEENL